MAVLFNLAVLHLHGCPVRVSYFYGCPPLTGCPSNKKIGVQLYVAVLEILEISVSAFD